MCARHPIPLLVTLLLVSAAWGCTTLKGSKGGPELTSSASSETYALRAPERAQGRSEAFQEDLDATTTTIEATAGWPDALSKPGSWQRVKEVHEAASQEGRSRAIADHLREEAAVKGFIEEHEADMAWRINSSVQAAAKSANKPTVDATGAIRYGLGESTDAVARKQLHESSEAHALIDAHEDELGKRNIKPLREQADALIRASYFLYVDAPARIDALRRDQEESDALRETLNKAIADQRAVEDDPKAARGAKRAAQKRRAALEAAVTKLDETQQQRSAQLKGVDDALEALQRRYEDAIEALLKAEQDKG